MQSRNLVLATLAGALFVVGCNRAESPGETQDEVAAQQDAADEAMTEAREQVAQSYPPGTPATDAPRQAGRSQYDVAIADAEAAHKAAVEACEALAAEEQQACKHRADDDLGAARSRAESLRLEPSVTR